MQENINAQLQGRSVRLQQIKQGNYEGRGRKKEKIPSYIKAVSSAKRKSNKLPKTEKETSQSIELIFQCIELISVP